MVKELSNTPQHSSGYSVSAWQIICSQTLRFFLDTKLIDWPKVNDLIEIDTKNMDPITRNEATVSALCPVTPEIHESSA